MRTTNIFNHGRVLWDDGGDDAVFEQAIAVHVDSGGTIVMEQEGDQIVFQPRTVEPLCKVLHELSRLSKKK